MSTPFNAAFKRWFRKSKVVDAGGEPLVVYHGTGEDFTEFGQPGEFEARHPSSNLGIFFSESAEIAAAFAPEDGVVMPVYLSIQKPFGMKWAEFRDEFVQQDQDDFAVADKANDFVARLIYKKFDGIFIEGSSRAKAYEAKANQWVVFDPKQIKSATGNDGTWDADDADIRSNPPAKGDCDRIPRPRK